MGLDEKEDCELLKSLKKGEVNAFRKVYEKYHKQLYSFALKYLRNRELAQDAVHDIFVKLWENRKKLDAAGSLSGYLFTMVKNHVLNLISNEKRKLKKHVKLSYEKKIKNMEPSNIILLSEYRDLYQIAVEKLPEKRQQIFKLRTNEGLTNKEVARYLEISVNTVKSQYYKASKFIKSFVENNLNRNTGS